MWTYATGIGGGDLRHALCIELILMPPMGLLCLFLASLLLPSHSSDRHPAEPDETA